MNQDKQSTPKDETEMSTPPLETSCGEEKEKLLFELEEAKRKYLSTLAELENMRKRLQKERIEMTKFAVDEVIADFIEPIEQLEKAMGFASQMSHEVQNWALGFTMILGQFKQVIQEHGITSFGTKGDHFDPHLHEAIEAIATDEAPDGIILEILCKGYRSSDRMIRPAKVKVAKSPKKEEQN